METLVLTARLAFPALATVLVNSLWQGVLLAGGAALLARLLRSVAPAVRTWIWMAMLVFVLASPLLTLVAPEGAHPEQAEVHVKEAWSSVVLALWGVLVVYRAMVLLFHALRLKRIAGRSREVVVEGRIQASLQGTRVARLCVSAEVNRPSVAGFFRPRVLLPAGLLETLSATELEHVVLHEMEHLRRYDDWFNLLQQVSLMLMPCHPALLWLDRRLCRDRELACDDGVLTMTQARRAYAACLVRLAEESMLRKGLTLALSALGTRARESELVGRVQRILAGPERHSGVVRMPWMLAPLLLACLVGAGVMACGPLVVRFDAHSASLAQENRSAWVPTVQAAGLGRPLAPQLRPGTPFIAHPMLTSAVVSRPVKRASAPERLSHRKMRVRRGVAPEPGRAVWHDLTASSQGLEPRGRVVLTEFDVSQPVYAAVSWQGGWLIVQL